MSDVRERLKTLSDYYAQLFSMLPKQLVEDKNLLKESLSDESETDLSTRLKNKLDKLKAKRCKPGSTLTPEERKLERKRKQDRKRESRYKKKQASKIDKKSEQQPKLPKAAVAVSKSSERPIFNKEGNIVFSKFDFSDSRAEKFTERREKTKKTGVATGKNYKQILDKLHKTKEKLEAVGEVDEKKAGALKEKLAWKTALCKAEGIKVKNDESLLKKALKRQEKEKVKRKTSWKKREVAVEQKKEHKQEKRKSNIMKKKQARKDQKVKLKKKKDGRRVPGF